MIPNSFYKKFVIFVFLVLVYLFGNNIQYFFIYADFVNTLNKIQNCTDGKIIDRVLYGSNFDSYTKQGFNNPQNFDHIKKFNSNGDLIDSWGIKGSKDGQFLHPHGIGSDSQGNIFVSDAVLCNIQKFDKNGKFLLKFGRRGNGPREFLQPESIAIDKNDNVFVVIMLLHISKSLTTMVTLLQCGDLKEMEQINS